MESIATNPNLDLEDKSEIRGSSRPISETFFSTLHWKEFNSMNHLRKLDICSFNW